MQVLAAKSAEELVKLGAKEVTPGNSTDKHGPRFSHTHKLVALVEGKETKANVVENVADLTQMKLVKARFFMLVNSEAEKSVTKASTPTPSIPSKPSPPSATLPKATK